MKKKILSALLCIVLTALFLLSGCAGPKEGETLSAAPEWTKNAVVYEVNFRQYTPEGTFQAFLPHLSELREMGINTLYFMPVHPISETNRSGSLGSYYSISDYRAINPEFGTEEDFRELVKEAHRQSFHVIMDWVANHTGWDHVWIKEHPDWYTKKDGEIISPENMGWPDVADLNYDSKGLRREMIRCMKYWADTCDIDGYRCDYAPGVPRDFWEEARRELDKGKKLFFLAEDLGWVNPGLLEYAFDSNYGSRFYEALVGVAKDNKTADKLRLYLPETPEGTFVLNYLDNHDVNSYDRTIVEAFGTEALPAMFTLIFSIPGMPMLYSGDEIGYDERIAFMEKDPIRWDQGIGDYRELISVLSGLKGNFPSLEAWGTEFTWLETGNRNVLAFRRTAGESSLMGIFNLTRRDTEGIDLSSFLTGEEKVLIHGEGAEWAASGEAPSGTYDFSPWEFFLLEVPVTS